MGAWSRPERAIAVTLTLSSSVAGGWLRRLMLIVQSLRARLEMGKRKRKLTAAEKRARKKRRQEFMTIFVNGKQKRVRRPMKIDGLDVDEFIRRNADPIWLHQQGLWEYMNEESDSDNEPF